MIGLNAQNAAHPHPPNPYTFHAEDEQMNKHDLATCALAALFLVMAIAATIKLLRGEMADHQVTMMFLILIYLRVRQPPYPTH